MQNNELIQKAEALYAKDSLTPEQLAKETGLDFNIFRYISQGLGEYVDTQSENEPDKIARSIGQQSNGLVDYQVMLKVIVDFARKASKIYERCQSSEYASRKGCAIEAGMDWTYFEDFYWKNHLDNKRGDMSKLHVLNLKIDSIEKLIA